jgi:phenylacetate-coenzyme A ligase PaaK-like adenylate-forming protein
MRVSLECLDPATCDRSLVEENFLRSFFKYKKRFENAYNDGSFKILFNYTAPGALELYRIKGRPKRIVDRR